MRPPLFLIVFLFFFAACNTTERIVHFPSEPTSGMQMPANTVASLQSEYGNVDGVYLKYGRALEHNVSIAFTSTIPHWKFFEIVDRSFIVFNPRSPAVNAFRLEVPAGNKLQQALITVQAPGSLGQTYEKEDLVSQTGPNGDVVYTLDYLNVAAGSVITEKYEMTRGDLERNPPVFHDVPLQYNLPVRELDFQYIYPIWWQVQVKNLNLNQPLNYQRIEDPDRRKIILKYTDQNVPAFQEGSTSPYFKQAAPYFQLQVTSMTMGNAVKYRAPEDWTEFAGDYEKFAVARGERPSRDVQKAADQILGSRSTEMDRVEAALGFVKDNIQIVEGSQHRSLDAVLSRREGNTYQATSLMQAMLQVYNIDSEYLLIHPAYEGYFDPDFHSNSQLKEPALGVFINGEQYYVFPGRQRSISEAMPNYYAGQTAMVVTEDGFGGFTEVASTQFAELPGQINIAGNTGDQQAPVENTENVSLPPLDQQTLTQPATSEPAQNNGTTPVNTSPRNSVVGSPNAGQPAQVQPPPVNTTPTVQQTPVVEVSDTDDDLNELPEWLGSIKRSLGGWTWIVASRTSIEEAEALANQYVNLFRQGISVDVLSGEADGVVRYRIAVGQYSSRSLAQADRPRFGPTFPSDAWLLEIKPSM